MKDVYLISDEIFIDNDHQLNNAIIHKLNKSNKKIVIWSNKSKILFDFITKKSQLKINDFICFSGQEIYLDKKIASFADRWIKKEVVVSVLNDVSKIGGVVILTNQNYEVWYKSFDTDEQGIPNFIYNSLKPERINNNLDIDDLKEIIDIKVYFYNKSFTNNYIEFLKEEFINDCFIFSLDEKILKISKKINLKKYFKTCFQQSDQDTLFYIKKGGSPDLNILKHCSNNLKTINWNDWKVK